MTSSQGSTMFGDACYKVDFLSLRVQVPGPPCDAMTRQSDARDDDDVFGL